MPCVLARKLDSVSWVCLEVTTGTANCAGPVTYDRINIGDRHRKRSIIEAFTDKKSTIGERRAMVVF